MTLEKTLLIAVAAAITATAAYADAPTQGNQPIDHPFRVAEEPKFAPVETTLDQLVAKKARGEVNHLCVVGQSLDDGSRQAWVYWQEGKAIILWEPVAEGVRDLASSRRYLKLDHDVVPASDKRLTSGSSHLVSSDWSKGLIAECQEQGASFVINRHDAAAAVKAGGTKP